MPDRAASHSSQPGGDFKSQLDQALGLTDNYLSELTDRLDLDSSFLDACKYLPDNKSDQAQPPSKTLHELGHLARQFSFVLRLIHAQDRNLYENIILWMQCFSVDREFIYQLEYLCGCREDCSGPPGEWDIGKVRLWLRNTLSEFYEASLSTEVLEAVQQTGIAHHQPVIVYIDASSAHGLEEGSQEHQFLDGCTCELEDTSEQPEAIFADGITLSPTSHFPDHTVAELSADVHSQAGRSVSRDFEEPVLTELNSCHPRFSID
ncbi:hypothetical protein FMUND_6725 [Fusarium mundagurra]|uniref:Uncharacterized protein n=1 Tax=Fusarium mundagurra TaxID=1567541 RepID=A0A8H5YQX4_9HYPO|nr:hypothetical protein FMUND_6725 [Fusarium mundagurra]